MLSDPKNSLNLTSNDILIFHRECTVVCLRSGYKDDIHCNIKFNGAAEHDNRLRQISFWFKCWCCILSYLIMMWTTIENTWKFKFGLVIWDLSSDCFSARSSCNDLCGNTETRMLQRKDHCSDKRKESALWSTKTQQGTWIC